MIGFSAGAFLAARLAIGAKASRPDFVALLYGGLRTPVPADAPPAFIAGTADDEYLPNDAVQLYSAWRKAGVAAELHVYERGGHGFGLEPQGTTSDHWLDALIWWMQARGLMAPVEKSLEPGRDGWTCAAAHVWRNMGDILCAGDGLKDPAVDPHHHEGGAPVRPHH